MSSRAVVAQGPTPVVVIARQLAGSQFDQSLEQAELPCSEGRWCTERRFQRRQSNNTCCRLGCGNGEDSIEHYCRCTRSREFARTTLKIDVSAEKALNVWLQNAYTNWNMDTCRANTIWIYAVYIATNQYTFGDVWPSAE